MLVCVEVKSDSGSGLACEVERLKYYIEGHIGKIAQLIVTEEEYTQLNGLAHYLGVRQEELSDLMAVHGIPVVRGVEVMK